MLFLSAYQLLKLSFFLFSEIPASFCTHFRPLPQKFMRALTDHHTRDVLWFWRHCSISMEKGEETPHQAGTNYGVGEDRVFCLKG